MEYVQLDNNYFLNVLIKLLDNLFYNYHKEDYYYYE